MRTNLMWAVLFFSSLAIHAQKTDILALPDIQPEERICFALYTVHDHTLKLTAQLYPLHNTEDIRVYLEINRDGEWEQVAGTEIIYPGYTAPFRVEKWDDSENVPYRVVHNNTAYYYGTIKKNPVDQDTFTIFAFTGNSIYSAHGGDIPRTDIVENIKKADPDLLFFSGDQVYDHARHYNAWLKFGRDFGEVISNIPTICIPDDHDVGHANLWGAGGRKCKSAAGDDGGYYMPVEYVNEVQRAQTSHLPDPVDPEPVDRGIGIYFTRLTWGGISFAILEDRKFKSGPDGLVPAMGPRPDHIAIPDYDPDDLDVPGAVLLGERQLGFLEDWGKDWTDARMKVVLSQTVLAGGAHIHGSWNNRLYADMDSNGWPQSGRNKALDKIRKAFALMIAGDQHLGTVIHHGIDRWNDAGYSFCVPSIANLYLRWWAPLKPGKNRKKGAPEYTGEFEDGFGNKITMLAVANPDPEENHNKLTTRAAGFGVIKLNKRTRKITLECWPRNVDITDPGNKPYPGWPVIIDQEDNYGREAAGYLPELNINKSNQVVSVISEGNGETIYTLRIRGNSWRPKVFRNGLYTIRIGEGINTREIKHIESSEEKSGKPIRVEL